MKGPSGEIVGGPEGADAVLLGRRRELHELGWARSGSRMMSTSTRAAPVGRGRQIDSHVIDIYLTVDRHNQLNPPFIKVFGLPAQPPKIWCKPRTHQPGVHEHPDQRGPGNSRRGHDPHRRRSDARSGPGDHRGQRVGIPPEISRRSPSPSSPPRKAGQGTGLGLWIADQIVRGAGGVMTFSSPPGGGTTFTVSLPMRRPDRATSSIAGGDA